jgi:hypothetical protein
MRIFRGAAGIEVSESMAVVGAGEKEPGVCGEGLALSAEVAPSVAIAEAARNSRRCMGEWVTGNEMRRAEIRRAAEMGQSISAAPPAPA